MVYFILTGDEFCFYGNLKKLCDSEGLGYSKFSKHFASSDYYEDEDCQIWKGELVRGKRAI